MGELRLRVDSGYDNTDVLATFDDQATFGMLADELESAVDEEINQPRSIQRISRGEAYFSRDTRIVDSDLLSGDQVRLALDNGMRAVGGAAAAASIRVIDGPDAGRAFELRRGDSIVGRSSACDVSLNDDMASRRHAIIRVSDVIEVVDNGSTNGVLVNDEPISEVTRLRPSDQVTIGDTKMVIDLFTSSTGTDLAKNGVHYNRTPRMESPFEAVEVKLPGPLPPPPKQRLPMATALAPLLLGGVMFFAMRALAPGSPPIFLIFMLMSPVIAVGSFLESRFFNRKEYEAKLDERNALFADKIDQLNRLREAEIGSAFRFAPGMGEIRQAVDQLTSPLWERKTTDHDFLRFRIGVREQPSSVMIEVESGGNREDRADAEAAVEPFRTLPPVPFSIDGRLDGPIGLAGPLETRESVARWMMVQAACLHSPDDLIIGAIMTERSARRWDWLKWLPHTGVIPPGVKRSISALGVNDGIEVIAGLNALVAGRLEELASGGNVPIPVPHVLVLVDGGIDIESSRFSYLLDRGPSAGVTVFWDTDDPRRIPKSCGAAITVDPGGPFASVGTRSEGATVNGVSFEGVPADVAEVVARSLAPVVDIWAGGTDESSIPKRVSLVDLLDGGLDELASPKPILERWRQTASGRALRAPVGAYGGGTLSVDLRVDGPHGLVGGTTGAGKSEFLQSFLTALAAFHSPDRLNFLLVDYKGGSAFGGLVNQFDRQGNLVSRGLPHTVGMITDLTPALVERALESLRAELHRRETILAELRLSSLMEMEEGSHPEKLANLLIVVDEFAALAKEVPKFVDGVVDIAQRGRSLGLHLLLATQKPGGVITANIQANTNLRVALRTASEEESRDLVNAPDAGLIDRSHPGRGVVRRGPTDLVRFQSAYVGGVTKPASSGSLDVSQFYLGAIDPLSKPKEDPDDEDAKSDLERLVAVINTGFQQAGMQAPRRPWLDPVPPVIDLLDLARPQNDAAIVYGVTDLPHKQARELAVFRPDTDGSLLIYGMGGSGKTVALRTLAAAFGLTKDRSPVHVHCLDFAARGLELLEGLPHVGSIIYGHDYERVTRLLSAIREEIDLRASQLAKARSSNLTDYRRQSGDPMARMVILLDGYDNFSAMFGKIDGGEWTETIHRLVADGRAVGVHFFMTGTRRASFPVALASQVPSRLVFRMASDDDYHAVGVDPKLFDDSTPSGRGRLAGREVQVAVVGGKTETPEEAATLRRLGRSLREHTTASTPVVRSMPTDVKRSELPAAESGLPWALNESFGAVGPTLDQHLLIAGPRRSGRSTALLSLYEAARKAGLSTVLYDAAGSSKLPGLVSREELIRRLSSDQAGVLFIDNFEKLSGSEVDPHLQTAMNEHRVVIVGAAHIDSARGGFDPLMKLLRAHCDALVLQPKAGADDEILGGPGSIPRTAHQFPPGRGYLNLGGNIERVQVAAL